jgi:23S rRNA pseudouridine1911/1915/1917 synthase
LADRIERSRAAAQAALKSGAVTVSGRTVRPSYRLAEGDLVEGDVEIVIPTLPGPEDIPVQIRYQDDRVLVISKPAGVVTHPGAGHTSGTLVNALLGMGGPLSGIDPDRPGIVHRLDKDTSGLLLIARDDAAHELLAAALKRREIERTYVALVRGVMEAPTGSIEAPVGRHPTNRRKMGVTGSGRDAVTHYRVIEVGSGCSLLEVRLETGRTHQIRVHLSHIKHPVLGDRLYGGRSELAASLGLDRPFLHACKLAFSHPSTGERIEVEDPLPPDLAAALERAGLAEWLGGGGLGGR